MILIMLSNYQGAIRDALIKLQRVFCPFVPDTTAGALVLEVLGAGAR